MRNREFAWTPVGLDLVGAKNVDEALRMAELDFTVDKKPIYNEMGKEIPKWFRNERSDNHNVLGIVTNKYKIVQNKDAFQFVDNLVTEGMEFEKGGIWHCGSAVWVEAKLPKTYNILGDDVESHVVMINSHDGKGAVKVCMIPARLFCSNQLNFALKSAKRSWSVVHSSKVEERIEEARMSLGLADIYMKELSKESERLALEKMTDDEFFKIVEKIYPITEDTSKRRVTNIEEIKSGLLECLNAPDVTNFRGTKYGKLMATTDFFNHREPQRTSAVSFDSRWESIANGDKDVDKFYSLIAA